MTARRARSGRALPSLPLSASQRNARAVDRRIAARPARADHDRAAARRGPEPQRDQQARAARRAAPRAHRACTPSGTPRSRARGAGWRACSRGGARRGAVPPGRGEALGGQPVPRRPWSTSSSRASAARGRASGSTAPTTSTRATSPATGASRSRRCTACSSTSPTCSRRTSSRTSSTRRRFAGASSSPRSATRWRACGRPQALGRRARASRCTASAAPAPAAAPRTRSCGSSPDFAEPLVNVGFEGFERDFHWPRAQARRRDRRARARPAARPARRRRAAIGRCASSATRSCASPTRTSTSARARSSPRSPGCSAVAGVVGGEARLLHLDQVAPAVRAGAVEVGEAVDLGELAAGERLAASSGGRPGRPPGRRRRGRRSAATRRCRSAGRATRASWPRSRRGARASSRGAASRASARPRCGPRRAPAPGPRPCAMTAFLARS